MTTAVNIRIVQNVEIMTYETAVWNAVITMAGGIAEEGGCLITAQHYACRYIDT